MLAGDCTVQGCVSYVLVLAFFIGLSELASVGFSGNASPFVGQGIITGVANITTSPGACLAAAAPIRAGGRYSSGGGIKGRFSSIWCDGQPEINSFYTVTPPNGPSCINNGNTNADGDVGMFAASSYHTGRAQALLADGSVRFISENIDTGNLAVTKTLGARSPYGVWGALGAKQGGETIGDFQSTLKSIVLVRDEFESNNVEGVLCELPADCSLFSFADTNVVPQIVCCRLCFRRQLGSKVYP